MLQCMTDAVRIAQEGDAWFTRNAGSRAHGSADPVLGEITRWAKQVRSASVLEIGCAEGTRLDSIRGLFGASCTGVEGSALAVARGREMHPKVRLEQGVAPHCLAQFADAQFDLVIIGFMQYLMPRSWEFALAYEVDRILVSGGRIVTYDFLSPIPSSREYGHDPGLRTYKADPTGPWTWNPSYALIARTVLDHDTLGTPGLDPAEWITVDTLVKLPAAVAYPPRPSDITSS